MNEILNTNPVTQEKAFHDLSKRYQHISTQDLVAPLLADGWEITKTAVTRARKQEKAGFQRHMLRLRNPNLGYLPGLEARNESFPEIVVTNSHDGTSAAKVALGIFRLVCSNGLVAGRTFTEISVRHTGTAREELFAGVGRLVGELPRLVDTIQMLQGRTLTAGQQRDIGAYAAEIRFNEETIYRPEDFLSARRYWDRGDDAFSVLNRVQENLIKGGVQYGRLVTHEDGQQDIRYSRTRAIRAVKETVDVNQKIFDRVLEIAG